MSDIEAVDKEMRILVVDDHGLTRDMVRVILRGFGFQNITPADNISAAYDELTKQTYDLVICDWNMPNGTGIDFLRLIRSNDLYKTIPFLMLTAEAYKENVSEAMQAGVSDYIVKPFTADVLGRKIARAVKAQKK